MIENKLKSLIIPKAMKENIDKIMEEQLFNANRHYAESNFDISLLMEQASNKCSSEFLAELEKRWKWHNYFYEVLLEPSYLTLVSDGYMELSPSQLVDLIKIYKTCLLVDEATLVMSGAIKKHLDRKLGELLPVTYGDSCKEEAFMLVTPPEESFYNKYQIDHLNYILLLRTDEKKALEFKDYLLKRYHANDEIIFASRFKKFDCYFDYSLEEIGKYIERYKLCDSYKIKHFYFTLEHPERRAYSDIVIFDNVYEKFIASNLIGISGFLLRITILKYLNDSGYLKNNGYIYEHSDEDVLSGLNKLLMERKKVMEKNVHPYSQRGQTCAICCMIMVLEYYGIISKANWYYENKYYRIYKSNYMDGTPFSALAYHFVKNGIDTEIMHSEVNIFKNDFDYVPQVVFENSMDEYKTFLNSALLKGAKVTNGIDITASSLRKKLEENNLVILAGKHGDYLHAILLVGYEGNTFIVCDPLFKEKQRRTFEEIESFMDTPIGKWCVVVKENTTKKDELMDNLDHYQSEANEMLGTLRSERTIRKSKKMGD